MRHLLLLSCLPCAMFLPLWHCVFAKEPPGEEIHLNVERRISVSGGHSLSVSTHEKHRVVFADGYDWFFERKDGKWLISSSTSDVGRTKLYLSFRTEKPAAAKADLVRLIDRCDETCLWNLDFEAPSPEKTSTRWCYASPTAGDFRGWFMAAGEPIEKREDFVLSRSVTLQKDKSPLALLRLWVDGP